MRYTNNWTLILMTVKCKIDRHENISFGERYAVHYWRTEFPELVRQECADILGVEHTTATE